MRFKVESFPARNRGPHSTTKLKHRQQQKQKQKQTRTRKRSRTRIRNHQHASLTADLRGGSWKHTSHVSQEGGESGVELHDRNSRPDTDEDHGHSQYSALFISRQSDSARVSESTLDDKEDDPVRRRHTSLNSNSPPHERARARTRKRKPKRRRMRKRKRNAHRPRGLMLFGVKVLQCKRTVFPRSVYQTNLERRKTTNSKQRTKNVNKSTPNLAVNANNRAKFPTFQLHAQDPVGFMYNCCVRPILTWVLLPCYRLRLKCSKVPPCLTYNHDCRAVVCVCVCVFVP